MSLRKDLGKGTHEISLFAFQEKRCKPSMLTPIKYIPSESFLNIDSSFGFCLHHIDHNKQHQHFVCYFVNH